MQQNRFHKNIAIIIGSCLLLCIWGSCKDAPEEEPTEKNNFSPSFLNYTIIRTYPHDTTAFTEGLLFSDGELYESTGSPEYLSQTESMFGKVNLETGTIKVLNRLDKRKHFGEGICILNGRIYQLTYQSRICFVYDLKTLKKIAELPLPAKEGWGLTTDGKQLIMSDGSYNLYFIDPAAFSVNHKIEVNENGILQNQLNELEYVEGTVFANIWNSNLIVKIDVNTGRIVGKLDLTTIASEVKHLYPHALEMNGIAYNIESKTFLITGKMWPLYYELKVE